VSIKTFGLAGLAAFREAVKTGIETAEAAQAYLEARPNREIVAPATPAVINFRYRPDDGALTEARLDRLDQHLSRYWSVMPRKPRAGRAVEPPFLPRNAPWC